MYVDAVVQVVRSPNAFNAMNVDTVDAKDINISAYNFLNIQLIFDLIKVLESWDISIQITWNFN